MLNGIPINQLEIIIAHELAHIKRHDYLFQFIQGILELLFFYHPVVWWLSSVVNTEREHICDDLAVKVCGESLTLIKALNNMEAIRKKRFEMVLGLSGKKDNLFNRVQRIVRPKSESGKRTDKLVFSGLFVLLFTGLILVSNFAISGNAFSGKQFFSKINVIDQKPNQGAENNAVPIETDKKKKKSKKSKKETEIVEVAPAIEVEPVTEVVPEIEIAPEVETEVEIEAEEAIELAFPEDSLKSKEWIESKVNELIEEQKRELKEAVIEMEEAHSDIKFDEIRIELESALKELNAEDFKKEIEESKIELEKELRNLSDEKYLKEVEEEQEEELKSLKEQLQEIEENNEFSDEKKAYLKRKIKEALKRVNSAEFKEQMKVQLERSKEVMKKQLEKMKSTDFESQMNSQREAIKKQLEKFNSPEYQKELQEKLERNKESIQKQLERINTPEFRKELEEKIKNTNPSFEETYETVHETMGTKMVIGRPLPTPNSQPTNTFGHRTSGTHPSYATISSKNPPLILLDNKKITEEEMHRISPNSIESITVLKERNAIAEYGTEAKNGVIIITSKKGNSKEVSWTPNNTFEDKYSRFPSSTSGHKVVIGHKATPSTAFQLNKVQKNFEKADFDMLIVVDGEVVSKSEVNALDPNEIESMNVCKGKAAIDLYGDKAANGVIVIQTASKSNGIKIKGEAGKNAPLYILDGKPLDSENLKSMSPDDIESISVLKDESATKIYGDDGKNGVILITSKKSKPEITIVEAPLPMKKSSFSSKDSPLYIVDGKKINAKKFNKISPDDIESIYVLKDKSAIEKYGKKGKNGVIEITLKK